MHTRALFTLATTCCLAGCDFITPVEEDPNLVPAASLDQLLAAVIVGVWDNGDVGRYDANPTLAAWLQQLDGVERTAVSLAKYSPFESDGDYYGGGYASSGMVSAREGTRQAREAGRRVYEGIFGVHEALVVGRAAGAHGDVPYTEAVNPEIVTPRLDEQREVYEALQTLLDNAIADLESGEGVAPGAADLIYGGDADRWIAAAHTLKARLHLHWVEVDGSDRYSAALTEAQRGIADAAGDWLERHTASLEERNAWHYMLLALEWSAGEYLVEWLKARGDPRLPYYYSEGAGTHAGTYVGSPPGEPIGDPGTEASRIACADHTNAGCQGIGYGSAGFEPPVLSCAENHFIMAEAHAKLEDDDAARSSLDDALGCVEDRWALWGVALDLAAAKAANDALIGDALFDEIMEQKYAALFLHSEVWNDYKRTCRPALTTFNNQEIPGRLPYPVKAREANPNIPPPSEQPLRNDNDPNPCPPGP
jgi:hypothetical protein